jgi:PAS domain S-box-containing protein
MKFDKQDGYFLSSLLTSLPHHVFWKDKNLEFKWCNENFAKQFGYSSPKDLVGKTDRDLPWSEQLRNKYIADEKQILATGEPKVDYESHPRQTDGSVKTVLVSKTPVYDDDGNALGILGVYTDMTDKKEMEKCQKEKRAMLKQISQAVEILSGCIAHELRTPLSIVDMNVDRLQLEVKQCIEHTEDKTVGERLEKLIDNIKFAVKSGINIVDMLLVKLRGVLSRRFNTQEFTKVSIKKSIEDAIHEYPFYGDEAKLIVWDSAANEDFEYRGNDLLTKHILFNLVKNALRAIKEANKGKIYINLSSDENFNYLTFKDTAMGVPAEILESMFAPFRSKTKGGAGIGLAFCKMTMQSYDGDIKCNSKEGEYAEFVLSFPKI